MATNGINFSGLSSNIQWGDIVDTTVKALEARTVQPISDRITQRDAQREAWKKLQGMVETLNDASRALRRTGFSGFTTTVPVSPTSSRALLAATASSSATPGTYRVEVTQLADTAKVGGATVADTGAALGLSGSFAVGGATISVSAADSLQAIRTKINSANSGASATGITATVVSDGGTAGRLVLTRDSAGEGTVPITDGTGGIARELGLVDTRTKPMASATMLAAALGLPSTPPPASVRVGGVVISIDLAVDSLSAITAKINAAGGSAAIESVPFGSQTRYLMQANGNVSAVSGDANSQTMLDYLSTNFGLQAGTTSAVRQTVQTGAYTSSNDGVAS
ncbi:MAG: flagellar hook-associated protein 2, partial [Gemmatimonadota bacterium]